MPPDDFVDFFFSSGAIFSQATLHLENKAELKESHEMMNNILKSHTFFSRISLSSAGTADSPISRRNILVS